MTSEAIEVYRGHMIYQSLQRHPEHVGGVMYAVDAGLYFAEAESKPTDYDLPGQPERICLMRDSIDKLKDIIDQHKGYEGQRSLIRWHVQENVSL